jgi:hypothetical protein
MSSIENDPKEMSDSVKLDQLLRVVATLNTRLDRQSQLLTLVETAIPLLTQACGVTLPTGSACRSSGTVVRSGAAGAADATPPGVGDDDDPGDGQDNHMGEPRRNGSNTGSDHGGAFVAHGGYDRGQGGGIGIGRNHGDDPGARHPKITFQSFRRQKRSAALAQQVFHILLWHGTPVDESVWMASLHLDDVAVEWYYALECYLRILTWQRFSEFVNMRFGPPMRHNRLAAGRVEGVDTYRHCRGLPTPSIDIPMPMQWHDTHATGANVYGSIGGASSN